MLRHDILKCIVIALTWIFSSISKHINDDYKKLRWPPPSFSKIKFFLSEAWLLLCGVATGLFIIIGRSAL